MVFVDAPELNCKHDPHLDCDVCRARKIEIRREAMSPCVPVGTKGVRGAVQKYGIAGAFQWRSRHGK